ncbi:MAG: hypothetical protein N2595_09800 [bacterium]|nr:hypothetical protein [bacterium]
MNRLREPQGMSWSTSDYSRAELRHGGAAFGEEFVERESGGSERRDRTSPTSTRSAALRVIIGGIV